MKSSFLKNDPSVPWPIFSAFLVLLEQYGALCEKITPGRAKATKEERGHFRTTLGGNANLVTGFSKRKSLKVLACLNEVGKPETSLPD